MSTEIVRPRERLEVTYKGEKKVLFFSFQRQNSCIRILGEPDALPMMLLDPNICEAVLAVMLAPTASPGASLEFEVSEDDLDYADVELILEWVQEHLSYFFMKRFQQLGIASQKLEPLAAALKSSLIGSADLSSNEPSAGPLEPVQAS